MLAKRKLLVASALALFAVPVMRADETSNVAPASLPSAVVKCPGITNIPLTADPEQALPLQVVRTLRCGEVVAVLADSEGYTALIRTNDGKDGYVARMYLAETTAAAGPVPAVVQRPSSQAKPVNGVVRWMAGAPGCDSFVSRGRRVESATANGITVQVSVQDTGWKYRANIAINNGSGSKVDVTPGIITLDELQPRMRILPAADEKQMARTATHQVLWTSTDAVPSPSAVESHGQQSATEAGTPDYLSPRMTLASARPAAFERTETVDVDAIALKYATVDAGQKTAGVMWFARDAGARELSMRVPVGDTVFDFSFAFEQKK
jgi:hypothetical protein